MDVAGACVGLAAALPLLLFAAVSIKLTSRGPVVFGQEREGLGGRRFLMYKLRTMVPEAEGQIATLRAHSEQDGPAFKMSRDPRVTTIGRLLRKWSIDELPQLLNVLTGDMSLVGPRPLPTHESRCCELWQRRRLDVTPGITGIWQVRGRNRVSFDEWMRMDIEYVDKRSLWQDLRLMWATIPAVISCRGAQ